MSLRWSSYIAPKSREGGSKTQNGRFPSKIALRLKKVCYKVSLCENYQQQSCNAFIGLTDRAKMIGGGDPFYLKVWIKVTALERNCGFSIASLITTQPSEKTSINTNRTLFTRICLNNLTLYILCVLDNTTKISYPKLAILMIDIFKLDFSIKTAIRLL